MTTLSDIFDKLGRGSLARRLGVVPSAISNAEKENLAPASWYAAVENMCEIEGVKLPKHLFKFKGVGAE